MKVLVALVLFVAAVQGKAVENLEFIHKYVEPDTTKRTAEEWDKIYAAVNDIKIDDASGLVLGTVPQDENAGKVISHPETRVISGTAAAPGDFPWQAIVIIGGSGLCGGSLISSEWVLTAAHCLGANSFRVTLGATSRSVSQAHAVAQDVREALIHANYNPSTIANDIGLLRLPSYVVFNSFIDAVRLPRLSQGSTTFEGASATVSGFGRTSSILSGASNVLLFAELNVIGNTQCAATFPNNLQASNICTVGANGRSPCNGDSGGPLVVREADGQYTEVGIVSFGIRNCPAGRPAAFVRVTSFLNWISSNCGLALRP